MAQRRSTEDTEDPGSDVLWWTRPNLLARDRRLSTPV
ncbi:protein of unknown function [Streptantibioticus cattleyicolor NRRL 8057 = DSM 46488]|nr:protein of unknown function [Streptantibioticus cattleyicolor NRRL 8057 = DSM 46488]